MEIFKVLYKVQKLAKQTYVLTLNVPGDCGWSRPTWVEPRLRCIGITWQARGRCVGSAAHSPLHAIAAHAPSVARAIELPPTHFARVLALGVLHTHKAVRALCVGPLSLRRLAHFATLWRPIHWYPFPCNFQPIQFAIQANHAQYFLKPIPFLNPRSE